MGIGRSPETQFNDQKTVYMSKAAIRAPSPPGPRMRKTRCSTTTPQDQGQRRPPRRQRSA
eukprot:4018932-Pyramimonas_sp.AAC.1